MSAYLQHLKDSRKFCLFGYSRWIVLHRKSTTGKSNKKENEKSVEENTPLENDWIGPADKVSNIRKFRYAIPKNEMKEEREFRKRREEVQEWHHQFWSKHNKNFFTEKDEFVKQKLKEKEASKGALEGADKNITAEEMSEFYKKFLDKNYILHKDYNKEWYKKNISLLWPAVKVKLKRMFSNSGSAG